MQRQRNAQRGFTLLEIMVVLIIVGVLIAAILITSGAVSRNAKEARANEILIATVQNIRGLYRGTSTTTGMTMNNLRSAKVFPADTVESGTGNIINPWNGNISITHSNGSTFTIQYTGVPSASCIEIVSNNTTAPDEIGLTSMVVGSTPFTQAQLPITPANATTPCTGQDPTNISWTFNLRG